MLNTVFINGFYGQGRSDGLIVLETFVFKPDGLFLFQSMKRKQKSCQKKPLRFFNGAG